VREPAPEHGPADQERHLRWNFAAAVVDAAGWGVGMTLISATTILPLFVRELTPSPVAVGMIQAVMLFGWLLPGILVSGAVDRFPRVKPSVMWIAALERLVLLALAPLCLMLGPSHRPELLWVFFGCWGVMNLAMGANTPGYYKLIAKTIPASHRGRLYGIGGAASGFLGMAAALPAGWFLAEWGFPGGFAGCFAAAAVVQTLTVLPLGFMREPVQEAHSAPEPIRPAKALGLVREDPRLFWIGAALALFSLNLMVGGFYTLHAIERFGVSEAAVARTFTAAVMAGRTLGFLSTGWLGDRFGNRLALGWASAAGGLGAACALAGPDVSWTYAALLLNEVAVQGWSVCSMNYVLELCPPERSARYTAVFALISGPFRILPPLICGKVVELAGYGPVFTAAAVGAAAALVLLACRLPEPRHQAQRPESQTS
jgi:MFS family permease